jgi:hypothetical protein
MKLALAYCTAALAVAASAAAATAFVSDEVRVAQREEQTRTSPRTARVAKKAPPLDTIEPDERQRAIVVSPAAKAAIGRARPPIATKGITVALDDFPYQAQDFAGDERVLWGKKVHNPDNPTSTWQKYAYDLGASRPHEDGIWRDVKPTIDWKNPKNSDYYIYKKPVYAISEGVIVNCWRNAPENPRPFSGELDDPYDGMPLSEQTWLHQDTRDGKVFGSGNFIMVREANGNHVHYAHGRPGTVPQKLCPHNGVYLNPATWDADSAVSPAQQVKVKRGDFLFETGNVGTSSAPHLHIDRSQSDKATSVDFKFKNGLYNPLDGGWGKPQNAEWQSFAPGPLPNGPILVWPPRRTGGLWSWNGMDGKTWADYFRHMADSGYQMTWIDGYSVGGVPYFNTIWRTATAPWLGYALLTGDAYQTEFNKATGDGFSLMHADSVLAGGKPYYNAIFVKGPSMDFVAKHGQNNADFNATFQDVTKKGYSSVTASVVSVNGQRQYTTLYRKQDLGGWVLLPDIPKADYQQVYNENAAAGRRPYYVNAYKHGNGVFYTVVFSQKPAKPPSQRKDRHGMSAADYQTEFNSAGNLAIQAVSGVDGASANHEYIAIWRKD